FYAEREREFVEVEKCFKKNRIDSAIEQRAELLAKNRLAVDAQLARLIRADSERPDAACDICIFSPRRLLRELRRRPVDLVHAVREAVFFQSHRVRAERVRLD